MKLKPFIAAIFVQLATTICAQQYEKFNHDFKEMIQFNWLVLDKNHDGIPQKEEVFGFSNEIKVFFFPIVYTHIGKDQNILLFEIQLLDKKYCKEHFDDIVFSQVLNYEEIKRTITADYNTGEKIFSYIESKEGVSTLMIHSNYLVNKILKSMSQK